MSTPDLPLRMQQLKPVSYTHLDVDKRQLLWHEDPLFDWTGS